MHGLLEREALHLVPGGKAHLMSVDSSSNVQYALNYSVVMDLLGYSQAKLAGIRENWDQLIFSELPIIENLAVVQDLLKVDQGRVEQSYNRAQAFFEQASLDDLDIVTIKDEAYPKPLANIARPPLIFYTRGNLALLNTMCVSVVGSREASFDAVRRAQKVSVVLASAGYTVVSGLAKGIDTAAHHATLKYGGGTIGVIGTPITQAYPHENAGLQEHIAREQLLISQFPLNQPVSKFNFPTRNFTMAGMSLATIIVEAGETSGALHQATSCMNEGRLLFIMKSILGNKNLTWPRRYIDKGAIILDSPDTLLDALNARLDEKSIPKAAPVLHQLSVFQNVVND